jgi:hypothetical protein
MNDGWTRCAIGWHWPFRTRHPEKPFICLRQAGPLSSLTSLGRNGDGGDGEGRSAPTPAQHRESRVVPLYRLLQNCAFDPDLVETMSAAFEETCRALGLAERTDPLRDMVARKIIDCAQTGERDPVRLRDCALAAIRG